MRISMHNAHIMVTGATGLIGKNLINYLHQIEPMSHIIAVVHSMTKAKCIFPDEPWITLIETDINDPFIMEGPVDFIIHGVSITSSRDFVRIPVDTIMTEVNGTRNMLELARKKQVKSFVYLSSLEVYGVPTNDTKISENAPCNLDTMWERSCYPESKRLCESMCAAYHAQYGVPAKVIRVTQTFGPGIDYNDSRVFAEFARCAMERRDIVLHTKGLTKRSYLSTKDAARAILTVLLKGENGVAYNAANESTYCSIYEMAQLVAKDICGGEIEVKIHEENIEQFGYLPELKMNLDISRLQALGWEAIDSLADIYINLIDSMSI